MMPRITMATRGTGKMIWWVGPSFTPANVDEHRDSILFRGKNVIQDVANCKGILLRLCGHEFISCTLDQHHLGAIDSFHLPSGNKPKGNL